MLTFLQNNMEGKQALLREAGILRDIIRRIIKDLDEAHKNINIANATASAISLIGGGKFLKLISYFVLLREVSFL